MFVCFALDSAWGIHNNLIVIMTDCPAKPALPLAARLTRLLSSRRGFSFLFFLFLLVGAARLFF